MRAVGGREVSGLPGVLSGGVSVSLGRFRLSWVSVRHFLLA